MTLLKDATLREIAEELLRRAPAVLDVVAVTDALVETGQRKGPFVRAERGIRRAPRRGDEGA